MNKRSIILLPKGRRGDAPGFRIDPGLKLAYAWISDEIKHLKQSVFEQDYLQYEQRLNDVLNIGRNSK